MRVRQQTADKDVPWVFPSKRAKSGHLMPSSLDKMWTAAKLNVTAKLIERKLPSLPDGLVLFSARHTGLTNFNFARGLTVGGRGRQRAVVLMAAISGRRAQPLRPAPQCGWIAGFVFVLAQSGRRFVPFFTDE